MRRTALSFVLSAVTILTLLGEIRSSRALPLGRGWTPMDTTRVPGHTRLYPERLELERDGTPLVFASGAGGIGYNAFALRWSDSSWRVVTSLGYNTAYQKHVISSDFKTRLVWQTVNEIYRPGVPYLGAYLVAAEFAEDQFTELDTIDIVINLNWIYSGATSAKRRWVVKNNFVTSDYVADVYWSDSPKTWHKVRLPGEGHLGMAVAALDDTSALIAWADGYGRALRWGILRGANWEDGGTMPPNYAQTPHFRQDSNGKLWLAWTTWGFGTDYVQVANFVNGAWSTPQTLRAPPSTPSRYQNGELRPSQDRWKYPVITWVEYDADHGYRGKIVLAIPTEEGQFEGEVIEDGTENVMFGEAIRDNLGDVWLVWRTWDAGMFWTHSYVRARATNLRLENRGRHKTLAWQLDEPAPGSWWTVLRADGDEVFREAGQLRAEAGVEMRWTDEAAAGSHIQYKIRRDCLDARYRWESETVAWPRRIGTAPPPRGRPAITPPNRPLRGDAVLKVTNVSAGPLTVAIYDLQGRLVRSQTIEAHEGELRLSLNDSSESSASGVFFLRVRDSSGAWSQAVRAVILR